MKKSKNKHNYLFVLLLVLLAAGCQVKRPREVIPEGRMEEILYDYHVAKAIGDNLPYNENYKRYMYTEFVFKKHGITEAQFDSSLVWYTRNTKLLQTIYESINKKFKEEQKDINRLVAIRDNKPEVSEAGDSIDVWFWEKLYRLTGAPLSNRVSFTMPSDSNFQARDTLSWEMNYSFIGPKPDSTHAAVMAMSIIYSNDSIINKTKKVTDSGKHHIRLQSDTLGNIREVKGFIYYPENNTQTILLLDSVKLMRYHATDSLVFNTPDSIATTQPVVQPVKVLPESVQALPVTPDRTAPNSEEVPSTRRNARPRPVQRISQPATQEVVQ